MTTPEGQTPVQETPKNDKEYNFAQIRAQLERERSARIEAEERAAAIERSAKERAASSEDDDAEPYVDHKNLQKKLASFEKNLEQKFDQKVEQKARMMIDEERRTQYLRENKDFNQVMSADNVQKFADRNPALAESILSMPEGFERQKLVYATIKAMKIDQPEQKPPSIQETVDRNKKSPYYQPSGMGSAPYQSAGDFSEAGQKNAYEKLKELKRNLRL